jgi:2-polyprenyl-6-methoxyphenol hydroxylase-like FAD-dependent oxidoreductase
MAGGTGHAVVIGGSLAGMCMAGVLAGHADRVTIVDRDRFPDRPAVRTPAIRKGVPQAHHLHVLITAGQRALERLFPGFLDELRAAGGVLMAAPTDMLTLNGRGWVERFADSHHSLLGASRELIDWTLRGRLGADPRIEFRTGQEVVGLLGDADGGVRGVRLRARPGATPMPEQLVADLVVDASGRGSGAPDWLAGLGYPRPRRDLVDAGLGYASRRYLLPEDPGRDWKTILLYPNPPENPRGGVLFPIENSRWILTLGGTGEDKPPTDEDGFLEFAQALRSPVLYEAIRDARPDSPIHGFQQTANQRWHYDAIRPWPAGFLVVGDAACCFNPVYGQGMTVAAQTAEVLAGLLRGGRRRAGGLAALRDRTAQSAVADTAAPAWLLATSADLRYGDSAGSRPRLGTGLASRYLDRTADVGNRDPYVYRALADVQHMVARPTALLRPGVLVRVVRGRPGPPLWTPPPAPPVSPAPPVLAEPPEPAAPPAPGTAGPADRPLEPSA